MGNDQRLNDKPIVKDGAYIYVELADGSQGRISKSDLASVVAELMNTKDLFPFSSKGQTMDANITVPGIYHTKEGVVNLPDDSYKYGTLVVFNSGEFGMQLYMQDHLSYQFIYVRGFMGSAFRAWHKAAIS